MLVSALLSLHLLSSVYSQDELLKNPGFEDPFGNDNWYCFGCSMDHSEDSHTGQRSGRVTNRPDSWRVPSQLIHDVVEPGKTYFFSAFVKLLTADKGNVFTSVACQIVYTYTDGSNAYHGFSSSPMMLVGQGWYKVGGDFTVNNRNDIESLRLYVQSSSNVDFLIDTSSLKEVIPDDNWKEDADRRIEELRTSELNIMMSIQGNYDPQDITLEVTQNKHSFPFGSAVKYWLIDGSGERDHKYQDFFFSTFNWAVLEWCLKWSNMEPNRGNPDYNMAERAISKLESYNVPVRGHTIFWGKELDPDWVLNLRGDELRQEIDKRIDGVVGEFKDRLIHWDINNEVLHGLFYEETLDDPFITDHMFTRTEMADPSTVKFLNDYGVVAYSHVAVSMGELARTMLERGTPVEGLGVQSHLSGQKHIHIIKRRLDALVEEVSLPVYITELSVQNADVNQRAIDYENVIRLYFSHPAVEGILLWGFWDEENWIPNTSLVDGPNLELNAAGDAFIDLIQTEWNTTATLHPTMDEQSFSLNAFHGDYKLVVNHQNQEIQRQEFSVTKNGENNVYVNI